MSLDVPIKFVVEMKDENNRQPIKTSNVSRKEFFDIPSKDISKDISKGISSAPYKFLQDVSSFVDRSDYKEYQLDAHVDDAYLALTSRFKHLENAPKEYFMTEPRVKTAFAKLVALSIRTTQCTSGSMAQLDKMYLRINLEKKKIMHWFKKLEYNDHTGDDYGLSVLLNPNGLDNYKNSLLYNLRNPH